MVVAAFWANEVERKRMREMNEQKTLIRNMRSPLESTTV